MPLESHHHQASHLQEYENTRNTDRSESLYLNSESYWKTKRRRTIPAMAPGKPERIPAHAGAEPSEPSELRPEDEPREQLRGEREENPQVVMHKPGRQAADDGRWQSRKGAPRGEERLEGGEGVLDKSARDGFAGGGKLDRSTLKSRL